MHILEEKMFYGSFLCSPTAFVLLAKSKLWILEAISFYSMLFIFLFMLLTPDFVLYFELVSKMKSNNWLVASLYLVAVN